MSKVVGDIVTLSNIFEITALTLKKVGYEFHAPLSKEEEQEVISKAIRELTVGTSE